MTWHASDGLRILTCGALVALTLAVGGVDASAQVLPAAPSAPLASAQEMRQRYVWSTLGLSGALHAVAFGGYDQWRQHPSGWDQSTAGFAKRVGASYARTAIGDSTKYAVARALHHDPSFTRCECSGFARRLWHALDGPFVARNRDGESVLSPATFTGIAAGQIAAAGIWAPEPFTVREVARRTALSVVTKIGMDVFREFRPRRATRAAAPEPVPDHP